VDYRNAKNSPRDLAEMLKHSGGERAVPVIVDGGKVAIGFEGGT
jgi:glutaredoxin